MEPLCAAQDALLKVHERIVEEDLIGGMTSDDDNESSIVTARLLVPNNMVGCLLGKRGDVIQRLRSETGASIRVLPADHLPICAMSTDELVQISAKPDVAKRALYEVSTLLHLNPRKDKPPSLPMSYSGQNFHSSGGPMTKMLPPGNPMWPHQNSFSKTLPLMPWMGGYGSQPTGFGPDRFNCAPRGHGGEHSAEFSMKILCSAGKIGGVIGKGGSNVKLIQRETGTSIHVDASAESDERVIRVSAFEALWNPRSQTIDAIIQLQNKTSEYSEKSTIITRFLVPSSKIGCILGQGGQVINEMRGRTRADIRVYSKDDKPKCASEDEELVQISGNFAAAKDALVEIASRLRARTLRDANAGVEPAPVGPVRDLGLHEACQAEVPHLLDGGHEYGPQNYPVPPAAIVYCKVNSAMEANISNNGVNSVLGAREISSVGEGAGTSIKLLDPLTGGPENIVEFRGSSEQPNATHSFLQTFVSSSGQDMNAQQGSHQCMTAQQSSYHNVSAQQSIYQNMNTQHGPFQNMNAQQSPCLLTAQQGVYTNTNAPQTNYQNISAQQSAYQY
ncbi:hypothetical protein GH714_013300 [Hevea brasiliensis]|uniref:K Homology domain-containing protein n=1 Tax=Hevea brasiliensis TaxID=3981 RepID=A0A6A6MN54_HEVBR|nr:hypothetical protein GH714_013300 [Hevea brasiliensis]